MHQGKEPSSEKKLVSVIVPCYKVEQYLPRCLDSLVAQTLENIEIICINDGSPDRCIDILRAYEEKNPSKMVVIDKQNEGVWRGRQDAIAIARGEYIGFVDSDDYVAPTFCESLYKAAKSNNSDLTVCGFYRVDVESGEILTEEMTEHRESFSVKEHPESLLQLNGAPWNKLFKASLLKSMYDFENPPKIFDDMMMHLLVYPDVAHVSFVPEALVYYLIRSDSIMTTIDESKIASTYEAMKKVREHYQDRRVSTKLMSFLDSAAFLHLGISLMFRISCDKNANMKDALRQNKLFLDKNFPRWNTSKDISFSNAVRYGGPIQKYVLWQTDLQDASHANRINLLSLYD